MQKGLSIAFSSNKRIYFEVPSLPSVVKNSIAGSQGLGVRCG